MALTGTRRLSIKGDLVTKEQWRRLATPKYLPGALVGLSMDLIGVESISVIFHRCAAKRRVL